MNISEIMYNQSINPCAHIETFKDAIETKYKYAIIVLAIIHLAQLIVLEVYERKKKKGKAEFDDAQIVIDFMQMSSYVKLISVLFLIMSAFTM